jgi:hypothetical protein
LRIVITEIGRQFDDLHKVIIRVKKYATNAHFQSITRRLQSSNCLVKDEDPTIELGRIWKRLNRTEMQSAVVNRHVRFTRANCAQILKIVENDLTGCILNFGRHFESFANGTRTRRGFIEFVEPLCL